MKKEDVIKYLEEKGDADFVVRTKEEEDLFVANKTKEVEEKIIPDKIKEVHTRYDEDVFSIAGLRKNPTEKTYDFVKRVLASYKTDADKAKTFEAEITSLKEQIKNNAGDKQLVADLEAVRKEYNKLKEEKDTEVTRLQKEHNRFKTESVVRAAIPTKIKKGLPEEAVKALTDQAVSHLVEMGQWQDNKLVFVENGVVKRNPHNALEPYTAAELLAESLKNIIDSGTKADGGPDVSKEISYEKDKNGNITKVSMIIPDSVRTKEELSKYLVGAGLLRGTQEYIAAYKEYSAALPMR